MMWGNLSMIRAGLWTEISYAMITDVTAQQRLEGQKSGQGI